VCADDFCLFQFCSFLSLNADEIPEQSRAVIFLLAVASNEKLEIPGNQTWAVKPIARCYTG
jgi:hypothetical protein